VIVLSEAAGFRYLHFDSPWVQGAMRLARPYDLEWTTRTHDGVATVSRRARRDAADGAGRRGAGAACWKKLPKTRITVVESSRAVIDVCRNASRCPRTSAQIVRADAGEYVSRAPRTALRRDPADLYDTKARDRCSTSSVLSRLPRGARAGGDSRRQRVWKRAVVCDKPAQRANAFDDRVIALPPVRRECGAAAGVFGAELRVEWGVRRERARRLEKKDRLPAGRWAEAIEKQRGGGAELVV